MCPYAGHCLGILIVEQLLHQRELVARGQQIGRLRVVQPAEPARSGRDAPRRGSSRRAAPGSEPWNRASRALTRLGVARRGPHDERDPFGIGAALEELGEPLAEDRGLPGSGVAGHQDGARQSCARTRACCGSGERGDVINDGCYCALTTGPQVRRSVQRSGRGGSAANPVGVERPSITRRYQSSTSRGPRRPRPASRHPPPGRPGLPSHSNAPSSVSSASQHRRLVHGGSVRRAPAASGSRPPSRRALCIETEPMKRARRRRRRGTAGPVVPRSAWSSASARLSVARIVRGGGRIALADASPVAESIAERDPLLHAAAGRDAGPSRCSPVEDAQAHVSVPQRPDGGGGERRTRPRSRTILPTRNASRRFFVETPARRRAASGLRRAGIPGRRVQHRRRSATARRGTRTISDTTRSVAMCATQNTPGERQRRRPVRRTATRNSPSGPCRSARVSVAPPQNTSVTPREPAGRGPRHDGVGRLVRKDAREEAAAASTASMIAS